MIAPKTDSRPRVLLVDDQEIVRAGLRVVLRRAGVQVAGEAASAGEALPTALRVTPDVVLLDVRLPDGDGVEVCRAIKAVLPETKVLFLTAFQDEAAVAAAAAAESDGFLLKDIDSETLVSALCMAAQGIPVQSVPAIVPTGGRAGTRRAVAAGRDPLSVQEHRVLGLVAEGKTNKQIGAGLGLSPKTVKNYLSRIFQKLGIHRRSQAVAWLMGRRSY